MKYKSKIDPAKKLSSAFYMLKHPTKAEKELYKWLALNRVFFKKQCIIKGYIVDAYLPREKIVIEVDGRHHNQQLKQMQWDGNRDTVLKRVGYKTIRLRNTTILNNPAETVTKLIKENKIRSIRDKIDCGVNLQLAV